jgi:hypothetical protein
MVAALFFLIFPAYSSGATLLQVNGSDALFPLFFPVIVALLALLLSQRVMRVVAAVLMAGFVLIGGFSIGLFYIPAAFTMLLAACAPGRDQPDPLGNGKISP